MEQYPDINELLRDVDNVNSAIPTLFKYWWLIPLGLVVLLIIEEMGHQRNNIGNQKTQETQHPLVIDDNGGCNGTVQGLRTRGRKAYGRVMCLLF